MEITRNIILDLLPLYLANEVSADTRILIDKYLETDKELANVAKQLTAVEKPKDIPIPLSQNEKMQAYKKARRQNLLYIIIVAAGISIILVITIFAFFFGSHS